MAFAHGPRALLAIEGAARGAMAVGARVFLRPGPCGRDADGVWGLADADARGGVAGVVLGSRARALERRPVDPGGRGLGDLDCSRRSRRRARRTAAQRRVRGPRRSRLVRTDRPGAGRRRLRRQTVARRAAPRRAPLEGNRSHGSAALSGYPACPPPRGGRGRPAADGASIRSDRVLETRRRGRLGP